MIFGFEVPVKPATRQSGRGHQIVEPGCADAVEPELAGRDVDNALTRFGSFDLRFLHGFQESVA